MSSTWPLGSPLPVTIWYTSLRQAQADADKAKHHCDTLAAKLTSYNQTFLRSNTKHSLQTDSAEPTESTHSTDILFDSNPVITYPVGILQGDKPPVSTSKSLTDTPIKAPLKQKSKSHHQRPALTGSTNTTVPTPPLRAYRGHSALAIEPLLTPNPNRYVLFPIEDHELWHMVKQSYASVWFTEEIDLAKDLADWQKLTDKERHFLSHILAFFAGADGIINENLLANFSQEVQSPEAKCFYGFQIFIENVHAETYALLIDTYIKDPTEKQHLFNGLSSIPAIKAKADWALKWCNAKQTTFAERLIAFAAVEGIHFSGAFCAIFWLKQHGLLPGLCFANTLISHDEALHRDFACQLHHRLLMPASPRRIQMIIEEAVAIEQTFICDAIPVAMLGMNSDLMSRYIEFVADHLLVELGQPKLYRVENPFPWMQQISLQNKANFFERRVGEYAKSGVGVLKGNHEFSLDADF